MVGWVILLSFLSYFLKLVCYAHVFPCITYLCTCMCCYWLLLVSCLCVHCRIKSARMLPIWCRGCWSYWRIARRWAKLSTHLPFPLCFTPSLTPSLSASLPPWLTPSLFHSLPDSLPPWLTPSLTHSLPDSLTPWLTPSLTHSLPDSLTPWLTPSLTHSLPDSLPPWLTPSLTHSLPDSLTPWLTPSLTHSLPDSLTPWLTPSLTHSLPDSLPPWLTPSLTHSLPDSLPPWLTPSLTHSLPDSLPPWLTHSLTHSLSACVGGSPSEERAANSCQTHSRHWHEKQWASYMHILAVLHCNKLSHIVAMCCNISVPAGFVSVIDQLLDENILIGGGWTTKDTVRYNVHTCIYIETKM